MIPGRTPSPPGAPLALDDPAIAAAWLGAIDRAHLVLAHAADGTIIHANARFCAALGFPESALVGRGHHELLLPGTAQVHGGDGTRQTLGYRAHDGRAVIVRATACAIARPGGGPDGVLFVGHERTAHGDAAEPAAATDPAAARADIGRHVRGWVETLRPLAEAKGLALRCEVDPDLPQHVDCDVVRLRLIVLDLVGTAIARTCRGWVSVCVEPAWNDPQAVAISVADTGEAAALAANDAGDEELALAITSALAQLIGASLALCRQPGRGTRAELRLPLPSSGARPDPAPLAPVAVARDPRRDAPRVLVVEDHPVNQARALDHIARMGARGEVAGCGPSALAMARAARREGDPYRLVLLDMHLPAMGGSETACRLRAEGHAANALPIVALSALASAETIAVCLEAGMQGYLAKPIELGSLRYALDRWVPDAGPGRAPPPDRRKADRQAASG